MKGNIKAVWREDIKRGIILKYGQIKTAGYDLREAPAVRSGYALTLQTTDLRFVSNRTCLSKKERKAPVGWQPCLGAKKRAG